MKKTTVVLLILFIFLLIPLNKAAPDDNKFKKAHSVVLKEIEHIKVAEDGSYVDDDELFIKIIDEKGRRTHQLQSFYLNRHYSTFKIDTFEIIKPDGRVIKIDWKKNARETTPSSSSEMNIYDPNQKLLNIFVPGLSIGDILHYKIIITNFKPMIPGEFFGRALFQQSFPMNFISLDISLPKSKKLHFLLKDKAKGASIKSWISDHGDNVVYHWEVKDVPEIVPEPDMIEPSRVVMRLLFSTMKSWKDVSRWYYNLVEPKLRTDADIKKKVAELIEDRPGFMDKVSAIFFFVSRKIRYMGLIEESNRPGYEPHDVKLTFHRRYGVCRDKAALLVAMLREIGAKAVPTIIKAGGKLDPEIPVPYFNHAIVAILNDYDEPIVFLDPTSETTTQFLPDYEQDSSCLPATRHGSDLMLTPVKNPEKNLFSMNIEETLDKNGNLTGKLKISTKNFIDSAFRSILMYKSIDGQRRFLESFLYKKNNRLQIDKLTWQNPSDTSKPFTIELEFSIPKALTQDGRFYPISLAPSLGLLDDFVLAKASMTKRKYPLRLNYTFKTLIEERICIEEGPDNVFLPKFRPFATRFFFYSTDLSSSGQCIEIKRQFMNKALEIPIYGYEKMLEIQSDIKHTGLVPIIFQDSGQRRDK